jgi:hypothetical protein
MATEIAQGLGGRQMMSVKSFTDLTGTKELSYTLACATAAVTDLIVLPGLFDIIRNGNGSSPTWQTNITFSCTQLTKEFSGKELTAFFALMAGTRYSVKGMRIKTTEASSGTANLNGLLTIKSVQIDGEGRQIVKDLSTLKENVGNGYSDKIQIPVAFVKDEKTRIILSTIAVDTSITVTLIFDGVNDIHDFAPIGQQSL